MKKYFPMIIVSQFSIRMIFVILLLSGIEYFIDGTSFFKMIEAPIFVIIAAIPISFIYSEIKFWIYNVWTGSILFGVLSINIFILLLALSKLVTEGQIGELPDIDIYLTMVLSGGVLLGSIYFAIEKKR